MVKAAKFAAICCVFAVAAWAPAAAMAASPKGEQSCDAVIKDPLIQAAVDRRAIGGDPAALSFRAVCSWPMGAAGGATLYTSRDAKVDATQEAERVKEAFFWTALNACTTDELGSYLTSSTRGSLLRVDPRRQQRFRSVLNALNQFPEGVKDEAKDLYKERLASLGAPGLIELARTAGCAIDADRVTMYGILDAVKVAWAAQAGVSHVWQEFNPEKMMANIIKNVPIDTKRAQSIRDALLTHSNASDVSLRWAAAVAGIDEFAALDLNWLLTDLTKFGFGGGSNPAQISEATLAAIGNLEVRAGQAGDDLNNDGDPPIYSDRDRNLTNVEIRNLVCWAAREKKGTTTGLIAEGQLAWMYAYGNGYPKDLPRARAIIADVLSGADRILSVVGSGSPVGQMVRAARASWVKISDDVSKEYGRGRRGFREFNLAGNYEDICPAEFRLPPLVP